VSEIGGRQGLDGIDRGLRILRLTGKLRKRGDAENAAQQDAHDRQSFFSRGRVHEDLLSKIRANPSEMSQLTTGLWFAEDLFRSVELEYEK